MPKFELKNDYQTENFNYVFLKLWEKISAVAEICDRDRILIVQK